MSMTAEAAVASHIKPTLLISGTFVTTDIKRARRMCEELLGLECVEPEKGTLLIREGGHQPGGPLAGKPYWVLEAREVATVEVPQEMLNHWGVFVTSQAAVDAALREGQRAPEGFRDRPRAEAALPPRLLRLLFRRRRQQLVGDRVPHAGAALHHAARQGRSALNE